MNKKGSNFLVLNEDKDNYGSDEDYDTCLTEEYASNDTKAVEEEEGEAEEEEEAEEINDSNSADEDTETGHEIEDEYEEYEGFAFLQLQDTLCSNKTKQTPLKSG